MRLLSSLIAVGAAAMVAAGPTATALGTRPDPVLGSTTGAAPGVGAGSILQMLLALGIVFGLLKFGLPKLVGKASQRLVTNVHGTIKVEESATFPGGTLYIVRARDRVLLLSVAGTNVTCLSDLTATAALEPEPAPAPVPTPSFEEVLSRAEAMPATAVVETAPRADIAEALARLDRLERLAR